MQKVRETLKFFPVLFIKNEIFWNPLNFAFIGVIFGV